MSEATRIRLIFEFDNGDDAKEFLDAIQSDVELETLTITGKWSWGAERVEQILFEFGEKHEHDD